MTPILRLTLTRHTSLPFFFFNDTATTEIYTLSLHDALPISRSPATACGSTAGSPGCTATSWCSPATSPRTSTPRTARSEEHTSELQSRPHLVCRLLLEKKNNITIICCTTRIQPDTVTHTST